MKPLKTGAFCVLFSLCFYLGFAQQAPPITEPDYNKPKLFASLPQSINIHLQSLESLFSLPEGKSVAIPLGSFSYNGVVVSKSDPSDKSVQSIVIRSTNLPGAAFTFTKTINSNGGVSFRGRIISREHSDAFELLEQNGQYTLTKKHQLKLMNE